MKFGLFGINTGACAQPETAVRVARAAEEAGFESVWTAEHVVLPDPQAPPSEMAVDVLLTGATPKRLRILVNGCALFDATIRGHWAQTLAFDECRVETTSMDIEFLSPVHVSPNDSRPLGVGIASVELAGR